MQTKTLVTLAVAAAMGLSACGSDNKDEPTVSVDLRVLETTDLHTNIMDYNYYSGKEDPTIGLARTASLIHAARKEVTNTVLVDNGDLLQGSPMGDYMAKVGIADGEVHPAYKAMNLLDYAVGNIGNHEFNYGLDFLEKSLAGAQFPYVNANVYCDADDCWKGLKKGDNLFTPYLIKETEVKDTDGNSHKLKIGYIGFVPPQIMLWDKQNLTGKVRAESIVESAKKFVPQMKAEGADIIIAIPHSGIGSTENPGDPAAENATYALTYVDGIDAIMFGHSHSIFPDARYADLPNTDVEKGLLNGVPAVMPGRWGDNMGLVDFKLQRKDGKWTVLSARTEARPIYDGANKTPLVEADKDIHDAVELEHQGTIAFVEQPIGVAAADMFSFLTLVQDDPTVQIVSDAQIANVKAKLPEALKSLPVLSAAAPFKAGGRHSTTSDADQYVMVDKGPLTFKNAADLYLYPNTMVAVKLNGAELKDWLECSANQFNQIDPASTEPQELVNYNHPTYNFDVIDGVTYKIDVTQPSKFDRDCALVNADASRIVDLAFTDSEGTVYTGENLAAKEFIVASNNYRAFGGKFAGTGSEHVVLELPDTNREALAAYITEQSKYNPETDKYDAMVNPTADYNWDFKSIDTAVALDIRFATQDSDKAANFIQANQQRTMTKLSTDELGFAVYRIDLKPAQ
ncbi:MULTISPECIES: bifunctional 2',3'-cyclic-nucleotide 2'-phosphodiesterase/3'-nucleotidase [Shewanella]|uniref:Bifunctional 2',3'-cyclic-nucleotide 2'-phosphodiesterase/3'-nucleotidase n=2 Tax=Unclassified Bacteria TaxID=49928 RepID=A0AAU6VM71_UNCXX|nr:MULTISPECIES: bifunctional 2',3'-cyclic-nucleotide 2'-phosphodiesterase/3'-nucleotidase [Shewanella]MBO2600436.1 bifunctional 2',3'-cyclic-nucleotide 2'-phosphodiesterase/3'-nucleotidase [Shewanella algae]MBO2620021.1 bifunctional 2',3'-cyclic-nucleotide 2'-phosphodiesterase/3'-nucleotidase [Shewanella algae]MCT8978929.1 bifunctional 2',3'-cyclic-nucleotide 2'-phosphodiesterase/3'-nucleotidase [Shewanella algae]MDC8852418.1 bifunctional 2',3'-cyclic-nucleotide 2'-phosphodiesterase/3'-nucleot